MWTTWPPGLSIRFRSARYPGWSSMWCQVSTITKRSTEASGSRGRPVGRTVHHVADAGVAEPAVQVTDHVGADVHGVDAARLADRPGEAHVK